MWICFMCVPVRTNGGIRGSSLVVKRTRTHTHTHHFTTLDPTYIDTHVVTWCKTIAMVFVSTTGEICPQDIQITKCPRKCA